MPRFEKPRETPRDRQLREQARRELNRMGEDAQKHQEAVKKLGELQPKLARLSPADQKFIKGIPWNAFSKPQEIRMTAQQREIVNRIHLRYIEKK